MLAEKCCLSFATMGVHPITLLSFRIQGTQLRGEVRQLQATRVRQEPSSRNWSLSVPYSRAQSLACLPQIPLGSLEKSRGF